MDCCQVTTQLAKFMLQKLECSVGLSQCGLPSTEMNWDIQAAGDPNSYIILT